MNREIREIREMSALDQNAFRVVVEERVERRGVPSSCVAEREDVIPRIQGVGQKPRCAALKAAAPFYRDLRAQRNLAGEQRGFDRRSSLPGRTTSEISA